TATSTPALTFSLSNAAAYTVLTNATGSAAAPSYGKVTASVLENIGFEIPGTSNFYRGDGQWAQVAPDALENIGFEIPGSSNFYRGDGQWAQLGAVNFDVSGSQTSVAPGNKGFYVKQEPASGSAFGARIEAIVSDASDATGLR